MSEGWSKDRMLGERVARFDTLTPTRKSFVDTAVDGHQRDIFMINGTNDPGRVEWPQALLDKAVAKGHSLDENGNLLESGASQ